MPAAFDSRCNETGASAGRDLVHAMDTLWSHVRAVGLAWGPSGDGRCASRSLDDTPRSAFRPSAETEQAMFRMVGRLPL